MSKKFCQNCMSNFVSNPLQQRFRMFKDYNEEPCEHLISPDNICGNPSLYSIDEPVKDTK